MRPSASRRLAIPVALLLCGCAVWERACSDASRTAAPPLRESAHVPSPSGWCEAYVVRWDDRNAQVILSFDGGACGSGAVTARGARPDLGLRWLDPTVLEVAHSKDVRVELDASGDVVQCGGPHRRVRVVLAPR